ncbi:MAG: cell division protein FtsA [Paludibacteraceae bacterium]|jgi:cell division protein FtsA|nr:cell division protein FtsA [Paludibacteraceae bacterium]
MNPKIIVAVDFGTSKIAVMAGEKNADGTLKILGMESAPTPADSIHSGLIIKPADVSGKLNMLLKLLENRIQKQISKFYISLNARSLRTCKASITNAINPANEIDQTILDKMQENVSQTEISNRHILNVYPQEYQLDMEPIKDPINSIGSQLIGNYVITIGKTEVLDNITKCVERSGYVAEEKIITPVASSLGLLSETEKELGCILLDFGAGTTSLSIFKDGYLRDFAVIPFGGKHITNDLKSLKIRECDAEKLKVLKGNAKESEIKKNIKIQVPSNIEGIDPQIVSSKEMATIIEARLREILNLIREQIKKSGYDADQLGAGIVITGGTSQLSGLDTLTTEVLGMNVRQGAYTNILEKESEKYDIPEHASLIGLLLYGTSDCTSSKENRSQKPKLPRKSIFKRFGEEMVNMFGDESRIEETK